MIKIADKQLRSNMAFRVTKNLSWIFLVKVIYLFYTMINPTSKQINELAESLDCGFRCFVNIRTGEIKEVPNPDNFVYKDSEAWQEDLEENLGYYL